MVAAMEMTANAIMLSLAHRDDTRRAPTPAHLRWRREHTPPRASRRLALPVSRTRLASAGGLCITHMSRCVRSGCTRSPWRGLPARVDASLPPPSGAGRGRWCAGTNLVQQYVYVQVSHVCLTDSMSSTSTFSTPVTRMGNSMPRAGS
jgi:hypothetical protein